MTTIVLCSVWVIVANVLGAVQRSSKNLLFPLVLVISGIPLLGLLTWHFGPLAGFVAFGAGAVVLRWPLFVRGERHHGPVTDHHVQPAE